MLPCAGTSCNIWVRLSRTRHWGRLRLDLSKVDTTLGSSACGLRRLGVLDIWIRLVCRVRLTGIISAAGIGDDSRVVCGWYLVQ